MLEYIQSKNLNGIKHGFFTRKGGVSKGDYNSLNCGLSTKDKRGNVEENRKRIINTIARHRNILTLHNLKQIHSSKVEVLKSADMPKFPEADALVTNIQGIILGVLTADCAPVLLADNKNQIVAAVHAGWRGAFSGIVQNTIKKMLELGANIDSISMAIGPTIQQDSYEIDKKFYDNFIAQDGKNKCFFRPVDNKEGKHWLFDLPGYILRQAEIVGITSVQSLGIDTYSNNNDFFSHRKHLELYGHSNCGRQLSVITI